MKTHANYELHNDADGYQATGTLAEMKRLGIEMIRDDKENGTEWVGPYWITDEEDRIVYMF